jgi:hypothetical protein
MVSSAFLIGGVALVELFVVFVLSVYTAYWALRIRHVLYSRVYREQALAVSVACLATGFLVVANDGGQQSSSPGFWGPVISVLVFYGLFFYVDATAKAARYSDPLLRDSLHWSKVRKVLWGFNLIFVALFILTGLFFPFIILVVLLPFVTGSIVIPVVARRTRDLTLRRHLAWLAIFFAFSFVSVFFFIGGGIYSNIPLIVAAVALYLSARSLAPVNSIEPLAIVKNIQSV